MLQQPGCSVGGKMSVAECGLGCHMEWLIIGRFCLISQIKPSALTALNQLFSFLFAYPTQHQGMIFLYIMIPSGCSLSSWEGK